MKVSSISVWCIVMAVIVAAASAAAQRTWTIEAKPKKYSTFLESLRQDLGNGTPKVCNISVTRQANNKTYVLVNLVLPFNGNTMTFALRASNGYLVGFQDTESKTKKLRANFFSDEFLELNKTSKTIFPGAEIVGPPLPCAGSYTDLQRKAGDRGDISLGVGSLQNAFQQVYGMNFTTKGKDMGKVVAKFALISIQMVAEAARFKYIEKRVTENEMMGSFKGGNRTTLLENNWSSLSQEFHNPARQCKPEDQRFTAEEMDLGLLQYKA